MSDPPLLEILPPPGRLTLDLACGDGRLARELRDRGHEMLAVDRSKELVRAARKADKRMEVLRADITRMPMGSGIEELSRGLEAAGFVIEALRETPEHLVMRARREP